ncbi:MAG: hypothetical protein LBE48_01390 [Methanomassiliicoccaceae archaeon]|nr:hypothetical protein [Methanomassiliicoccaceae archaeon]
MREMLSITVRSEKEDKRIPITVASDVMFDIQMLLTHIGESFIAEEFGSYDRPAASFVDRFTLYMDPENGGISFKASAGKGKSHLMEKAMDMLTLILSKMGSGAGTYWIEDTFKDPVYRFVILYDLMELSKHMAAERGYVLMFSSGDGEKRFIPIDIVKTEAYLDKNAKVSQGSVTGILNGVQSKRNVPMYGFVVGDERVKITFRSQDVEGAAAKCVNNAVLVKGTLRYSDEGELLEVFDIHSIELFNKKNFDHMISKDRDILLSKPMEAAVKYDNSSMNWKLTYPDLGMSSSGQDWDAVVEKFHDYFVFLYDNYMNKEDSELTEEELDVKRTMISMTEAE